MLCPVTSTTLSGSSCSVTRIDRIREVDKTSGAQVEQMKYFYFYPARHFVTPEGTRKRAIASIREELEEVLPTLGNNRGAPA